MTEIDDKMLEAFFRETRETQIEDDGFTTRVLRQLPDRTLQLSRLWTLFCVAVGAVLFVWVGGWETLVTSFKVLVCTSVVDCHPLSLLLSVCVLSALAIYETVRNIDLQELFYRSI